MDFRTHPYAEEDEFLSEADLLSADPSHQDPRQQLHDRIAYSVIVASALLLSGLAGFVVADYAHRAKPAVPAKHTRPATVAATPTAAPIVDQPVETTPATTAPPRNTVVSRQPAAPASGLSGWWSVTNRVESTTDQSFNDLNLGYRLLLMQNGNEITGSGHKWMENGRLLAPSEQSAIAVSGTVDGREVTLRFIEHDAERETTGTFIYEITGGDVMQGRFSSNAADATGSTQARRMSSQE